MHRLFLLLTALFLSTIFFGSAQAKWPPDNCSIIYTYVDDGGALEFSCALWDSGYTVQYNCIGVPNDLGEYSVFCEQIVYRSAAESYGSTEDMLPRGIWIDTDCLSYTDSLGCSYWDPPGKYGEMELDTQYHHCWEQLSVPGHVFTCEVDFTAQDEACKQVYYGNASDGLIHDWGVGCKQ